MINYYGCVSHIRNAYMQETRRSLYAYTNGRIYSYNEHDGNNYIYTDGGLISSTSPATTIAWNIYISSNTRTLANNYPLDFKIADIDFNAGKFVTVTV